ncbi:ABC transporter substrate-binding protein [Nocardioides sp. R-C-SC26]|uniref:ABC transporter substrate-binding protein n=1 Tax=Nocardioides sp. R-C-SC26 TaxID=2870414 RepID=UPI001E4191CC|nr:ABC transporter substrate-binding protein [Nocardioides sp. R-C-SC26]
MTLTTGTTRSGRRPLRTLFALGAVSAMLLTACGGEDDKDTGPDLSKADQSLRDLLPADVIEAGELQIASDIPYPPYEFYDTDGKTLLGVDPELAEKMGELLGIDFVFNVVAFDTMIPAMEAGKFDIAMTGMADTVERQKKVDFVDYMSNGGSFLVMADGDVKPTELAGLCGTTVGAQSGTVITQVLKQNAGACPAAAALEIKEFTQQDDIISALRSGRLDVAVIPSGSAAYLVKTTGDEFEVTLTVPGGPLGISVPKGNDELVEALRATLQKLMDDGTYEEVLDKYGLMEDNSWPKAEVNAGTE